MTESKIETLMSIYESEPNGDCRFLDAARAELAELRAADIRTMEHCEECGGLLVLDADAPKEAEPFCPFCELQKVRADLQAAQERSAEQARQIDEARKVIEHSYDDLRNMILGGYTSRKMCKDWLAANPAPQEQSA